MQEWNLLFEEILALSLRELSQVSTNFCINDL
jgi:hypothetical protein